MYTYDNLPDPRSHFIDGVVWYYWDEDIEYTLHDGSKIVIPAYFMSDGGSIPWVFTKGLKPNGVMLAAYHLHDYLYSKSSPYKISRKHADQLLFLYSGAVDYPMHKRQLIYAGVRVGGWASWKKHYGHEREH